MMLEWLDELSNKVNLTNPGLFIGEKLECNLLGRREIFRVRSTLREISPAVHRRGTWPTPGRLAKLPPLQAQTETKKRVLYEFKEPLSIFILLNRLFFSTAISSCTCL